jgi:iron(III) transport system substrate-binding protein
MKALGGVVAHRVPTTEAILTRVAKAEALIGYNAIGSYALIESKKDPDVGYIYPRDYTLVITRVMLIGKKAANPNAAKLWVDYLLSKRGQTVLANRSNLFSVRADVDGVNSAAVLTKCSAKARNRFRWGRTCSPPFPTRQSDWHSSGNGSTPSP